MVQVDPAAFARDALKARDATERLMNEAKSAGDKKAAKGFERLLRKQDKTIEAYGLRAYRRQP